MKIKNNFKKILVSDKRKLIPYIIVLTILLLSVGYSAFSSNLNISGFVASVRIEKDVRITGVVAVGETGNDSICTPSPTQDYAINLTDPGYKYECKVDPNKDAYTFYVLNSTESSVNLIMDSNINISGEPVKLGEYEGTVEWLSKDDYMKPEIGGSEEEWAPGNWDKGPITAMNYLQTATQNWTNLNPITVSTFTDDTGNIHNMAKTYNTYARLPYYSEISNIDSSTSYLIDNLEDVGVLGYWLLSADYSDHSKAWVYMLTGSRTRDNVYENSVFGVRPVITVPKDDFLSSSEKGESTYTEYNVSNISAGIKLPNKDSSVTFKVEITNIGNAQVGIKEITGLPENLDYELIDFNLNEKICDNNGNCNLGVQKEIQIKIKYKDGYVPEEGSNTFYDVVVDFSFQPYYTVTYTDITNNGYPTEVMHGETLTVNLGDNAPEELIITMNGKEVASYTYSNGILTIFDITGDVGIRERIAETYASSTSTLVVENTVPKELKGYKIYGNSIQDTSSGNPSPTNPIDVFSVGDKTKNLLSYKNFIVDGKTFDIENGLQYDALTGTYDVTFDYTFKANTTYILSGDITGDIYFGGMLYTSVSALASYQWISKDNPTIKIINNSDEDITRTLYCRLLNGTTDVVSTLKNLQLEIGDTKTEYEPYGYKIPVKVSNDTEEIITNIYLDEPLRSIGTYKDEEYTDYIDFTEGVVVRKVKKLALNPETVGMFTFTNYGVTSNNLYRHYISHKLSENYMITGSRVPGFTNVLPSNKQGWNTWTYEQAHFGQSNIGMYILLENSYSTITDLYNYLSNNGTVEPYFIYALQTSSSTPIDLPKINSMTGTTVISVETEVAPKGIEIQY